MVTYGLSTCAVILSAVLLPCCGGSFLNDFEYEGKLGPDHWGEAYTECKGKFQSPINIDESQVFKVRLPPLEYEGFETPPLSSSITNNGHTVVLQLNMSETATISGGPLPGEYVFSQLHFHWGQNDSIGSEDLINNHSFPMELHMVFYNNRYASSNEAMHHSDGLTVLAFFYEVIEYENAVYAEMVEALPAIRSPHSTVFLRRQLTLASLIPCSRTHFYTYRGSLTTPPCSEVVHWIDFQHPIRLSHEQVEAFRNMMSEHGRRLTHNARPVQPLGNRRVYYNLGDPIPAADYDSINSIYANHVAGAGALNSGRAENKTIPL